MTSELRGCVFFEFPVRHTACATGAIEPFVAKPSGSAAVSGVVGHEGFIAVGRDAGLVTHAVDGLYTVQKTASGGPELYFLDQAEQLHPFTVKSFGWFFPFLHNKAPTNIVATPICSGSWRSLSPMAVLAPLSSPRGIPGALTMVLGLIC